MANNYIQDGKVIQAVNGTGADVVSGQAFVAGATVVIAAEDIADGASGSVHTCGVFDQPKESGVALAAGDKVNFVTASSDFGTGVGTAAGIAAAAAAAGDAKCEVALNLNP